MDLKRYFSIITFAFFVIIIQLFFALINKSFFLIQLTMSAYYLLSAIGLCMLMGYAGQISLGQAGFFAIGGYTSAFLTTMNFITYSDSALIKFFIKPGFLLSGSNLYGDKILYLNPWIAFITSIIISGLIAFLIGIPVLKLKGHYLAMATLGFGVIIEKILRGSKMLGGADGLTNVPGFSILPGIIVSGDMDKRILNYYIAWFVVILGLILLINLINSRVGRALKSLHGDEEASNSMGINTSSYKLNVFIIAAIFSSVAGVFLTHYNGSIGPGEAGIMKSIRYLAIVAVGGMANLWGVVIMGLVLNFLSLRGIFGSYDDAVFGAILIMVMMFSPNGFLKLDILKRFKLLLSKKVK